MKVGYEDNENILEKEIIHICEQNDCHPVKNPVHANKLARMRKKATEKTVKFESRPKLKIMKTRKIITTIAVMAALMLSATMHATDIPSPQEEDVFSFAGVSVKPVLEIDGKTLSFMDVVEQINSTLKAPEGSSPCRVICKFTISSKGEVKDVKAIKGGDEKTKALAVEELKKLPKWKPGRQQDKPVAVSVVVPLTFR